MKIVAIVGANIKHNPEGTSWHFAQILGQSLKKLDQTVEYSVVSLVDKKIKPCKGCGGCALSHRCTIVHDDFQKIYQEMLTADGFAIICPHYSPIPAKLCALLERVESISFLGTWNDVEWKQPFLNLPCAIIAHGGVGEPYLHLYETSTLEPLINAVTCPIGMNVVRTDFWPYKGLILGPTKVRRDQDSLFPIQEYNFADVQAKIYLFGNSLYQEAQKTLLTETIMTK